MVHPIQPPGFPEPRGHYSPAVVHGGIVYVSGQLPLIDGIPCSADVAAQARLCLERLEAVLLAAFSDRSRVLKLTVYITDRSYWEPVNEVCREFFGGHRPARSIITCGHLHSRSLIEVDCIAAQLETP